LKAFIYLPVILLVSVSRAISQDKTEDFTKTAISDILSKNADAVCRLDEHDIEIVSTGKVIVRKRHVYTILNSNGEKWSHYGTNYNKLDVINYVNGTLYNGEGKELRHFKKKDMLDIPRDGEAFVSDDRMKGGGFNCSSYPYTVDFEEEDENSESINLPSWIPPRSEKMSVEISRYILTAPKSYKVRYRLLNSDIKPVIVEKKDKITYTWEIRNLPVVPDEPFSISSELYDPYMLVAPSDFKISGYSGSMSEWNDYGKFYVDLQKDRDVLPDDVKQRVHSLTDGIQDPYKKIAILYDYLQKNTHYVAILFGIGGLQPYDAKYVAQYKYGDCKALSNFMVALLKEAGIKGYPVIIKGDDEEPEFIKDFPSHQFNHVICTVPVDRDTVWLECTDQYLPAGYLGSWTANRYGLLINETGGVLVHTPAYSLKDNVTIRSLLANLDADGNLQLKCSANYKGLNYDPIAGLIHYKSKEEQMEHFKENFNLPTYVVNDFNFNEDYSSRIPVIHENLNIVVANYASLTGKRLFVCPNILTRSNIKLTEEVERKLDIEFKTESRSIDSVEISIPSGYLIESLPKDILLHTQFGEYRVSIKFNNDMIVYYRQLDRYRGRFPSSQYNDMQSFYNRIYNSDREQIVFVKKN
jgi:hypothetical protein